MKFLNKTIQLLLLLELLILVSAFFFFPTTGGVINFTGVALLSTGFMVITLIAMVLFFRGQMKDPSSQTMHSLVAVVLKFLLELVLALLWFFVAKKTSMPAVILFFVLYLAFTLFSVLVMVKTLKNNIL
ncbi:MAG: hypothetical protein JXR66_06995 [Bacteroidales bacterium]|nr:hypothetical protein [Bacteroidales bacterium]MBN2633281.1 hypothetical protein [Bacteroidales bacterium]